MCSHRFILTAIILGALSSCATAPPANDPTSANDPRNLAQEQWDSCSHFPSVTLVEITSSGQLIVRESSQSSPPNKYLRCVSAVAYKQVLSGRRNASDVVRHAIFITNLPARGTLSDVGGSMPASVKQFDPDQDVTFFYGLEGLDVRVKVTLVWNAPQGMYRRTTKFVGPTGPIHEWTWATDRIELPDGRPGLWSVQMFIQGFPAGEYQFQVLKPKV